MGIFDAEQTGTHVLSAARRVPPWLEGPLTGATGASSDYFQRYQSNPFTQQGLQGMAAMAQPGAIPGISDAFGQFQQTLGGDFLAGGPGFQAAMDAAARDIQPRVASAFNLGGRLDSGAAPAEFSSQLADAFAGL